MHMKTKLNGTIALAIGLSLLTFTLTGCGRETSAFNAGTTKEPITAYQAFHSESIWYAFDDDEDVAKDRIIRNIVVFDGKGNATFYQTGHDLTFADLQDKSDEEIIAMAKETDKAEFESDKESAMIDIDAIAEARENITSEILESAGFSSLDEADDETKAQLQQAIDEELSLENLDDAALDAANSYNEELSKFEYREPEAKPIELSIETDDSGNNTQEETVILPRIWATFTDEDAADGYAWNDVTDSIKLSPLGNWAPEVYDMQFGGYAGFVTKLNEVKEDYQGFTFDTPDTEGIKVDE